MALSVIEIEATNRCNTHCLHCPREAITRPQGMMSWDTWQIIADKISTLDVQAVDFSGMGEPTLNPLLPRFVSYFSPKMLTMITTNASTLTPAKIQDLIDAGLGQVMVSFNGHRADLYGLMMGGLDLEKVEQRIQDLVRLSKGKTQVMANVSVTKQTRPHLAAIKARLHRLGVRQVTFSLCHSRGGHLKDASICDTPIPEIGDGRCDIFAGTLFVAWNGQVLACCHDLGGEGVIGDLVTEEVETILGKRQQIMETGVRFPMCKECNDMYRFTLDATPDAKPLSEWIYSLYGSADEGADKLMEVIRRQESRISELEQVVAAYEHGRFIRFTKWLRRVSAKLR